MRADAAQMAYELASLRRAQDLLRCNKSTDEVVDELRRLFGFDFVDAIASVAAATLLSGSGVAIREEPFVRPYAARL